MKMRDRIELIHLLGEELHDTAIQYEEADCPIAGYDVDRIACKEALKRRIKVLREELLELSKQV